MKRFALAALLAAFACAPSVGWAETAGARSTSVGDPIARRHAPPAPADSSRDEAADYAAREAAAPALGQFEGGEAGIYIGGSAVGVLLILLVIVIIL